jgi:CheY-like chemotaxis protein
MKILALEDEPIAAMQLMAVLRSLGHEAEHVKVAAEAWSRLNEGGYRVVVSDWRMSGVDGLGLCRSHRSRLGPNAGKSR